MIVEGFVGGFGDVGVAFGAGEFGGVFVGFFDEFFYFGAGGVVVEEFVVTFFNAWVVVSAEGGVGWELVAGGRVGFDLDGGRLTFVDVGEVGTEACDGFQDCLSMLKEKCQLLSFFSLTLAFKESIPEWSI